MDAAGSDGSGRARLQPAPGGPNDGSLPHVCIVSSVRLFREGLGALVASAGCSRSVGLARDITEALAGLPQAGASLIMIDASDPSSPDTARRLRGHPQVLGIVAFASSDDVDGRLHLAEAGVQGYVARDGSVSDLLDVVGATCRGDLVCSPTLAGALLRRLADRSAEADADRRTERLSARERDIVRLLDEGRSNKEIARHLCIEVATVKNHIHHILHKLEVRRRGEAAALFRRGTQARGRSAPAA